MATKWKDLKHKASPETRERVKREALAEYAEMERERKVRNFVNKLRQAVGEAKGQ